jgi:hypothetical protein
LIAREGKVVDDGIVVSDELAPPWLVQAARSAVAKSNPIHLFDFFITIHFL